MTDMELEIDKLNLMEQIESLKGSPELIKPYFREEVSYLPKGIRYIEYFREQLKLIEEC